MAITTLDALDAAQKAAFIQTVMRVSQASTANTLLSLFAATGNPGPGNMTIGNTANGLIPDATTAGAFPLGPTPAGGLQTFLSRFDLDGLSVQGSIILYDRLFHAGSYALTSLGTNTLTSIPTITRAPADWSELEIYVEINSVVSSTATTVQVEYTNQSGTTGRLTGAVNINAWLSNRCQVMPLQSGDWSVQQITAVIIGGVVATAGSVNVFVARRLGSRSALSTVLGGSMFQSDALNMGMRRIWDNSCLNMIASTASTTSGSVFATYALAQG